MRAALLCLACVLVGLLVGRGCSASPQQRAGPSSPFGPARVQAGVGVGYEHSRAGAVLAAARYQQAFASPQILRPGVLRRRVEAVAMPDFAAAMFEANLPGTASLAQGPLGEGLRSGLQTVFFGVPIAYRVLAYSPQRARIRTWGFTLLGNGGSLEPRASFGLATTELRWWQGDWKIAATSASFGPTPRLIGPRQSGEGFELIELARGLRAYGIAP